MALQPLLTKAGIRVGVLAGASAGALFANEAYVAVGAEIVSEADAWKLDIVLKIRGTARWWPRRRTRLAASSRAR